MFRKTMVELDSLELTLLIKFAERRLGESKTALNDATRTVGADSIPADLARDAVHTWSRLTKRLAAALAVINAQADADRWNAYHRAGEAREAKLVVPRNARRGTRVRLVAPYDEDAIKEAVGRWLRGETGAIADRDAEGLLLVKWDGGGSCWVDREELDLVRPRRVAAAA